MNEDGQPPGEVEKWGMRASVIGAPPHFSRLKRLLGEEWSRGDGRGRESWDGICASGEVWGKIAPNIVYL